MTTRRYYCEINTKNNRRGSIVQLYAMYHVVPLLFFAAGGADPFVASFSTGRIWKHTSLSENSAGETLMLSPNGATVGGLPPFSVPWLGHSGKWLSTSLKIGLDLFLLAQRDKHSQGGAYRDENKSKKAYAWIINRVVTRPSGLERLKKNDLKVNALPVALVRRLSFTSKFRC